MSTPLLKKYLKISRVSKTAVFCQKFLVNDANRAPHITARPAASRRGGRLCPPVCVRSLVRVGRGAHTPPPDSALCLLSNASGGALSFCGERKGGKNAVKTKVLKSFPRLKCCLYRSPSATRIKISKFRALLLHGLCVYIRDALRACAGPF